WSWLRQPVEAAEVAIRATRYRPATGRIEGELVVEPAPGIAVTSLRVGSAGHRPLDVVVDTSTPRSLRVAVSGTRTGRRPVFTVLHLHAGPDDVVRSEPQTAGPVSVTVLPRTRPLG